ncbi:MAG TPA: 50S ribosomal protein L24 [Candidatus Gracilibacteria bacterium]|nr:50S ribosomal protein L24 [Candidatus Gracilibacteria bacterium]
MKLKLNDKVLVISGKDKGKVGRIIRVVEKHGRVVVEKVNIRTKHVKKTQQKAGERIQYEAPLSVSNLMILDPKENKPARIGYRVLANGKKERFSKLSGAALDNMASTAAAEEKPKEKPAAKGKKKTIKA